jgi:hypothetical protein
VTIAVFPSSRKIPCFAEGASFSEGDCVMLFHQSADARAYA